MFQELFSKSKTIGFCMENSKLRVIHKSLIFDAVKEGEETFLAEVLRALEEKYKKKESQVKLMLTWLSSKLGCRKTEENLEQNKNKDDPQEKKDNLETDSQQENENSLEIGNDRNVEETEESLEEIQSSDDTLVAHLQDLEDAHVQFARKTAEASNHEDVKKEIRVSISAPT